MKNYELSAEVRAVISYYFVNYGKFLNEINPLFTYTLLLLFQIVKTI